MSNPPGMLVSAAGTVDGIQFSLSNETDQEITVYLNVVPVPPTPEPPDSGNPWRPLVSVPPNSWPDNAFSVQYFWGLPVGVYDAFVQPLGGPTYEVGIDLVVTAAGSVAGEDAPHLPLGGQHILPDRLDVDADVAPAGSGTSWTWLGLW
jgi:hypothetical protein